MWDDDRQRHPGTVRVRAFRAGASLVVDVGDDGPGLPAGWSLAAHAGIGLTLTRSRLQHSTAGRGRLDLIPLTGAAPGPASSSRSSRRVNPSFGVLLVDDEPPARAGLKALLRRDPRVEIAGEAGDGATAVDLIRGLQPDGVFLDVQMPLLDGFDVVRRVGLDRMPPIAFVTAYEEHAIDAFAVHAVDYLLKPLDPERLARAVGQLQSRAHQARSAELAGRLSDLLAEGHRGGATSRPAPYLDRFLVRLGRRRLVVAADQVDWIEGARYYVRIRSGDRGFLLRIMLNQLSSQLDPARFLRIHRSTIMNLHRIVELRQDPSGSRVVLLQKATRLRVAEDRWNALVGAVQGRNHSSHSA